MRRRITAAAILSLAVVASTLPANARVERHVPYCDRFGLEHHFDRAKSITQHALREKHRKLSAGESERYRRHKRCLNESGQSRLESYRERLERSLKRRQFQARYLPYHFGEPTIRRVAIPPYVVQCETNGYYGESRWGARNPSGATGPYQLLPSTYGGVCSSCDWSRRDQHRAAHAVWARSGGSEWACA